MVAGVLETLAVQPLDMVKTRFQIRQGQNPGLLRGLAEVYREGGVLRFYRGMLPELASTAPARTAMYSSYTFASHELKLLEDTGMMPFPWMHTFLAGGFSGLPESAVVTPLQLVKVRLQAKEHLGRYRNGPHCFWSILSQEGPRALYLGFMPTTFRNCIYNAVYFSTMAELKALGIAPDEPKSNTDHAAALLKTSACAFAAGAFATCFNAPFDFAKSRVQQQVTTEGTPPKYTGTLQTLALVIREEGLTAVYKGFVPKVWRMACGGAVGMAAFEGTQRLVE